MKLSFKNILPILLIFTLLILFAGCAVIPDDQPGYTPGTITGIIAAPCCTTSADPVTEPQGVSPEYWCYDCENTWSLQNGVEVILTYGEDEVATVFTNEDGEYTFTNVPPGKNYVITALCPDDDDDRPLVKDVALEVVEGETYDAKITDCVSTSLGLVVDFLVTYSELGPEDIVLDGVIAGKPNFWGFPRFKKLVLEVCRAEGECVNLNTDEDVQDALCKAAEEVGQIVIPDLDLGCTPGFTPGPGPGPTPAPCDGDIPPVIDQIEGVDQVLLNGSPVSSGSTLPPITVGTPIEFCVYATDPDNKLAQPLTYSISGSKDGNPFNLQMGTVNCVSGTPSAEEVGTYIVSVNVSDGCLTTPWGPITVAIEPVTYTVTYNGNTNTGGAVPVDANLYEEAASVTVLGNTGSLVKTGYTFEGWNTAANGGGTGYIAGSTLIMGTSNVTLYAQWLAIDYYVYYDGNGNDSGTAPVDAGNPYNVGDTITVLGEGDLAKSGGYIFVEWNTDDLGGGDAYDPGDIFSMPASDVTLYAQWECDPCSGWDADITVILWYYPLGTNAKNDPRIDVDGEITGPDCAEITEINIEFVLYNSGGHIKETVYKTLTSQINSFTINLDIDPASYNAGDNYELWIDLPECGLMMIKEGPVVEL